MTRGGHRSLRRQRGVIGLLGVFVMLLLVTCLALALDTGRLYMEKRNLQRVADLTALEVASRVAQPISDLSDEQLTDSAEAAANVPQTADLPAGDGFSIAAEGGGLCRVPVNVDGGDIIVRKFTALSKGASASCAAGGEALRRSAVHIEATRTTRASLAGTILGDDMVTLMATATAQPKPVDPMVTFSLGSRLLKADGSGLLGTLLGGDINVTALGYEGLANATLSVGDLIDLAAEVGTANGLLEDVELNLADLLEVNELQALARSQGGDANVLNAGVSLFSDAIDGFIGLGLDTVRLGDILDVESAGADEALKAEVALGSLLETMVFVGDGRLIDLDSLGLDLGILGGVDVALEVIEPPQVIVGRPGCEIGEAPCDGEWITEVKTAQLGLGVQLQLGASDLGGLSLSLASLDVLIALRAASARAGVDEITPSGGDGYDVTAAAYQQPLGLNLSAGVTLLSASQDLEQWLADELAGQDEWSGSVMDPPDPDTPPTYEFEWAPENSDKDHAFTSSSMGDLTQALLGEADSLNVVINVLGLPVEIPASDLLNALEPPLSLLVSTVLDPLVSLLGLDLGAADLRIIEIQPSAGGAELVL